MDIFLKWKYKILFLTDDTVKGYLCSWLSNILVSEFPILKYKEVFMWIISVFTILRIKTF